LPGERAAHDVIAGANPLAELRQLGREPSH
jgi:hypothetical protein